MLIIGGLSWLQLHRHCCHGNICYNCVTIVCGCNFIDTDVMDICVAIVLQLKCGIVVIVLHVNVAILKGSGLVCWNVLMSFSCSLVKPLSDSRPKRSAPV